MTPCRHKENIQLRISNYLLTLKIWFSTTDTYSSSFSFSCRDFDASLYLCEEAFGPLPLDTLERLVGTLLLPPYILTLLLLIGTLGAATLHTLRYVKGALPLKSIKDIKLLIFETRVNHTQIIAYQIIAFSFSYKRTFGLASCVQKTVLKNMYINMPLKSAYSKENKFHPFTSLLQQCHSIFLYRCCLLPLFFFVCLFPLWRFGGVSAEQKKATSGKRVALRPDVAYNLLHSIFFGLLAFSTMR